uniref:Uncharacterized protein n=1 Tax=Setaria digitata TaxID=48799 RepID=A0A915Q530_9BILA
MNGVDQCIQGSDIALLVCMVGANIKVECVPKEDYGAVVFGARTTDNLQKIPWCSVNCFAEEKGQLR